MLHLPHKKKHFWPTQFRGLWMVVIALFLCGITSCGKKDSGQEGTGDTDADLDLAGLREHYQSTEHYSDNAKVILQYSLAGTPFEEVHGYSNKLIRNQSTWLRRFRCEILSDNSTTLARVLDSSSHNLGGQVLYGQQALDHFLSDMGSNAIGRHFLFGSDDIPWNKSIDGETIESIAGLPRLLFEDRPPKWFASSALKESSAVVVDGVEYIDAQFNSKHGVVAVRIDQQKKAIVGIRLPKGLLSKEISSAADVSGVSFAVLFEEVSFDAIEATQLKINSGEKPVSEFVKLPEDFPSQTIGTPMQPWNLVGIDGREFDAQSAKGAPAIFFYGVKQQLSSSEISRIESLSKDHAYANFAWVNPPSIPFDSSGFKFSRMGLFSDAKGMMLQQVEPGSSIFYLIANTAGTIQFVSKKKKGWLDEVGPTLMRVRKGDDVAKEMHNEYAKYFQEYEDKLRKASIKVSN